MNQIILMGNLTRDPELSESSNGNSVCRFSIAVSRDYSESNGNRETDFFNCTAFGKIGENLYKYFRKGQKILVVGRVKISTYTNRDGVNMKDFSVIVSHWDFCGKTPDGVSNGSSGVSNSQNRKSDHNPTDEVEDSSIAKKPVETEGLLPWERDYSNEGGPF